MVKRAGGAVAILIGLCATYFFQENANWAHEHPHIGQVLYVLLLIAVLVWLVQFGWVQRLIGLSSAEVARAPAVPMAEREAVASEGIATVGDVLGSTINKSGDTYYGDSAIAAKLEHERMLTGNPSAPALTESPDKLVFPRLELSFSQLRVEIDLTVVRLVVEGGERCLTISVWNEPAPAGKSSEDVKSAFATLTFTSGSRKTVVNRAAWIGQDANEIYIPVGGSANLVIGIQRNHDELWIAPNNPNKIGQESREWFDTLDPLELREMVWVNGANYDVDVRIISAAQSTNGMTLAHKRFRLERNEFTYEAHWINES